MSGLELREKQCKNNVELFLVTSYEQTHTHTHTHSMAELCRSWGSRKEREELSLQKI